MIGSLKGILKLKQAPWLLVDVNGVGYEVEAPMTTIYQLPELEQEVFLFTHLVVREDAQLLYAFYSEDERRLFRSLIKVNGIGARMALAILSGIEADEFALCVKSGDTDRLVKLPGIGKKTAERLIVEMKDRLDDWDTSTALSPSPTSIEPKPTDATADAISALLSLGYKPQEASKWVHAVATDGMNSEELIKEALKASVNK